MRGALNVWISGGPGLRQISVGLEIVGESENVVVSGDGVGVVVNCVWNGSLLAVDMVVLLRA
jgi:hypothetical protein